ncbi:MAG: hypothetical protein ACPGQD_04500 [Planctomycetota bacterium]
MLCDDTETWTFIHEVAFWRDDQEHPRGMWTAQGLTLDLAISGLLMREHGIAAYRRHAHDHIVDALLQDAYPEHTPWEIKQEAMLKAEKIDRIEIVINIPEVFS